MNLAYNFLMSNLFSIFTPTALFNLPLNWMSALTLIICMPPYYWLMASKWGLFFKITMKKISSELMVIFGLLAIPGVTFLSATLLLYIFMNNFLGLFPYIFTASSHLSFALTLSLPLWLGHMMKAFSLNPQSTLAHFVPLSTPSALTPFMVLIELISSIIRPFTLAVRLAANMIAGHLLLALLSGAMVNQSAIKMMIIIIPMLALTILELAVSAIQSYVFSLLMTLYLEEVSSTKII